MRHWIVFLSIAGAVLLGVQLASGCWTAEFSGHPDEAAQFVSGQAIRQWILHHPAGSPVDWAGQYYLHYPKVAIGHWPPGYLAIEGLWTLLFGPSRMSAMWLQWALCLASLAGVWALARPRFGWAISAALLAVMVATPVFQQGLEMCMAEPACLLAGVLFLHAMVKLLERMSHMAIVWVACTVVLSMFMKGTGASLAVGAVLAWLAGSRKLPPRWWIWLIGGAVGAAVVKLAYTGAGDMRYWSGIGWSIPWPIFCLGALAGWGFVALAACGVRRDPLVIASACAVIGTAGTAYYIRAMSETRHWILILPALVLLAGSALFARPKIAAAFAVLALVLFPYTWYRQKPEGYVELFKQVRPYPRTLISAQSAKGEGAAVAEGNILDQKLSRYMIRASKVFAESDWNGNDYRLLVPNVDAARRHLDELDIEEVILDSQPGPLPPHHALLQEAVQNDQWRLCARAGFTVAYCRIQAPRFPRVLLEVEAAGHHFVEQLPPGR